jgi:hypothetical protein
MNKYYIVISEWNTSDNIKGQYVDFWDTKLESAISEGKRIISQELTFYINNGSDPQPTIQELKKENNIVGGYIFYLNKEHWFLVKILQVDYGANLNNE